MTFNEIEEFCWGKELKVYPDDDQNVCTECNAIFEDSEGVRSANGNICCSKECADEDDWDSRQ